MTSDPAVEFSGEECGGKFLDLHEMHRCFVNSKFGSPDTTYLDFLSLLGSHLPNHIPRHHKLAKAKANNINKGDAAGTGTGTSNEYGVFLGQLLAYLASFYAKSRPLSCLRDPVRHVAEDFDEKWDRGEVEGWEDRGHDGMTSSAAATSGNNNNIGDGDGNDKEANPSEASASSRDCTIDLDAFETAEELAAAVDTEQVKRCLSLMGLKAGGTPAQKAERLMATKGKPLDELDVKLFAKGRAPVRSDTERKRREKAAKPLALLEVKVQTMMDLLEATLRDTKVSNSHTNACHQWFLPHCIAFPSLIVFPLLKPNRTKEQR